jgi:hypothetical protein
MGQFGICILRPCLLCFTLHHLHVQHVFIFIFSAKQKSLKPPSSQPEPEISLPTIDVPQLTLDDLKQKTDNFGSSALIGEGSYGRVYHATLDDGRQAAVKKLDASENEPNDEFLKQVSFLQFLFVFVIP